MTSLDSLFSGLRTSASGLSAERTRIDVITDNIANSQTTMTPEGGAFRRRIVNFHPVEQTYRDGRVAGGGVRVSSIERDFVTPMEQIHDPSHPNANDAGVVELPNINPVREMADLMTAVRAYEANLKSQEIFMRMAQRAIDLVR